ncbi:MAG: M48 family metallopeptidase, partial [Candidatus Omnitrophica bacterium]|nr:M48 family metallopeptidase [Candidatus Omnitrophota bacterium]
DYIASNISTDTEKKILGKLFLRSFNKTRFTKEEEKLQEILDKLKSNADLLPEFDYKVHIVENEKENAIAFPGGHIVVFSSLLKEIESENEIAMILAHELGHYVHRDHLRGLGRSFVFLVLSSLLFGADNQVSRFIVSSLNNVKMKFSQKQEIASDLYALQLLNKTYGHIGGALDFYYKAVEKEKLGWFFYFSATHPYPKSRLKILKKTIKIKNYKIKDKIPFKFTQ